MAEWKSNQNNIKIKRILNIKIKNQGKLQNQIILSWKSIYPHTSLMAYLLHGYILGGHILEKSILEMTEREKLILSNSSRLTEGTSAWRWAIMIVKQ